MTSLKNPQFLFLALAIVVLSASAMAEVPQLINYQGRLTDNMGDAVPNAQYSIVFTIYDNTSTTLWQETHASVTTSEGLFSVLLGAGDHSGYGDLDESIFSDSVRWLGIKVGEDPEITPRTRFVSAPYAHQATHAGYADSSGILVGGGGDITAVHAGYGMMGGGTEGEVTLDIDVAGGLSRGSDHIYITPNGVHSDRIMDGTISAADIDNTSVQQRVTGTAPPGNYITAVNADGSVVTSVDQTGTSKVSCAGTENLTVDNESKVRITFPITFNDAGSIDLSTSAVVTSASTGEGYSARVANLEVTTTYVDMTLECWNGSSYTPLAQDDIVQVSYTAIER